MDIPATWREAYRNQFQLAKQLKDTVDLHLSHTAPDWFTTSRIKEEESFYQKIETGRVEDINKLEDFFGAMIVVPLPINIEEAVAFFKSFFVVFQLNSLVISLQVSQSFLLHPLICC